MRLCGVGMHTEGCCAELHQQVQAARALHDGARRSATVAQASLDRLRQMSGLERMKWQLCVQRGADDLAHTTEQATSAAASAAVELQQLRESMQATVAKMTAQVTASQALAQDQLNSHVTKLQQATTTLEQLRQENELLRKSAAENDGRAANAELLEAAERRTRDSREELDRQARRVDELRLREREYQQALTLAQIRADDNERLAKDKATALERAAKENAGLNSALLTAKAQYDAHTKGWQRRLEDMEQKLYVNEGEKNPHMADCHTCDTGYEVKHYLECNGPERHVFHFTTPEDEKEARNKAEARRQGREMEEDEKNAGGQRPLTCLEQAVSQALEVANNMTVKCSYCQVPWQHEQLYPYIRPALAARLSKSVFDFYAAQQKVIVCPNSDCNQTQVYEDEHLKQCGGLASCPFCGVYACFLCSPPVRMADSEAEYYEREVLDHTHRTAGTIRRAVQEALSGSFGIVCDAPGCPKLPITKGVGECNVIYCTGGCGRNLCYLCGHLLSKDRAQAHNDCEGDHHRLPGFVCSTWYREVEAMAARQSVAVIAVFERLPAAERAAAFADNYEQLVGTNAQAAELVRLHFNYPVPQPPQPEP